MVVAYSCAREGAIGSEGAHIYKEGAFNGGGVHFLEGEAHS